MRSIRRRTALNAFSIAALVIVTGMQAGCSDDGGQGASTDIAALRAMVRIPDEVRSARWEVFGTPEYKGGIPAPTDHITLVAELETADKGAATDGRNLGGSVAIVPEAARPWLSADFRNLLHENRYSQLPLSATNACQPYRGVMTKSGRPVGGFICIRHGRSLLYLTLQSN